MIPATTFTSAPIISQYPPTLRLNSNPADNANHISLPASKNKPAPSLFTYALAHELRNPLTNIKLSVDMLEAAVKDDKLKIFLGIITRSTIKMNDLINELLQLNHGEVQAEKISIRQLLDEA